MKSFFAIIAFLSCTIMTAQNLISKQLNRNEAFRLDTIVTLTATDKKSVEIPMTIIKGVANGPTFTITAGIHGMEYPTIMSLVEMSRKIDPKKLKGNLIILPIVNLPAFFNRVPFKNPIDGLNLNRVFPGNKNGTITEVIADYLTNELFPVTDILLDMHGGDVSEDLIPFICYYDNKKFQKQTDLAARLSAVSGFKKIVSYPYTLKDDKPAEYAFKQAVRQGVTALSIEIGKLGQLHDNEITQTNEAIFRMLSDLKMYDHQVPEITEPKEYYTKQSYLYVPTQGFFYSNLKAGDTVKKGDILGHIKDVFGKVLQTIHANESGIILYKIGTPPVNVGETLFCIAGTK